MGATVFVADAQPRYRAAVCRVIEGMPSLALARGAAACVTRGVDPARLGEALLAVAAGGVYLPPEAQRAVAAAARSHGEPAPLLTARELEVLRRVAAGESAPAMNAPLHVAPSTVKAHLAHLYAKLDVAERGAAVAAGF